MPHQPERIVADSNCLVGRLLLPESVPAAAVRKALNDGQLLISDTTIGELADVLSRRRFDRYVSVADRQEFIRVLSRVAERVGIISPVKACRDPKDDKFLEVAINGRADLIMTGDKDLLALRPFRGVAILSPRDYLQR